MSLPTIGPAVSDDEPEVLEGIVRPGFDARLTATIPMMFLVLNGNADNRARAALETLLDHLHTAAMARHVELVDVDVRGLEFMNSSTIKSLVVWITRIADLEQGAYAIRFRAGREQHWFRRTLDALRCFSPAHITVDVD